LSSLTEIQAIQTRVSQKSTRRCLPISDNINFSLALSLQQLNFAKDFDEFSDMIVEGRGMMHSSLVQSC
jgi:hypothetical protein